MTSPLPIRFFAILAAVFLALAPSAPAATGPGPYSSGTCTSAIPNPPSDFINYTLSLQFPTTGYTLTLLNVTFNKNPVVIRVHYTLAPGPVGDIVTTHSVKFSQIAPHVPTTYVVIANGVKLGPRKKITAASPSKGGIQPF